MKQISKKHFSIISTVSIVLLVTLLFSLSSFNVLAVASASGSKITVTGNSLSIEVIYPEPVFCSYSSLVKQGSNVDILQNHCKVFPTLTCGMAGSQKSFNFSQSFIAEGNYVFKLEAQDCVGNRRLDSYNISVSFSLSGCGNGNKRHP